jgi:hypothetical protein
VWIRNTSRHSEDEVRECVAFAVHGVDMRRVCVNVKNGALGGAAYNGVPEISNAPRSARYLVTLRLGRGGERWPLGPINYHFKTPEETGPRNRFPFFVCRDWREWLVKLAAHEAKHIEQFRGGAVCSEIRCEEFAVVRLEQWRAQQLAGPDSPQLVLPGLELTDRRVSPLTSAQRSGGEPVVDRQETAA